MVHKKELWSKEKCRVEDHNMAKECVDGSKKKSMVQRKEVWSKKSCKNCGAEDHMPKQCFERSKKIPLHYTGDGKRLQTIAIIDQKLKRPKLENEKKKTGSFPSDKAIILGEKCIFHFNPRTRPRSMSEVTDPSNGFVLGKQLSASSWLHCGKEVQWQGRNDEKALPLKASVTSDNAEYAVIKKETQHMDMYKTLSGYKYDLTPLMPKLRRSDYYTLPSIQELAAKEIAEPGFCSHVKNFVVGRNGFGSIRFSGVTDVRGIDIESIVHFNNREVIVYADDSKKPPVGQGLNKPAEVTLLNIGDSEKNSGRQYTEGLRVIQFREILKRKAEEQRSEFVSYDPSKEELKFNVKHFNGYYSW